MLKKIIFITFERRKEKEGEIYLEYFYLRKQYNTYIY